LNSFDCLKQLALPSCFRANCPCSVPTAQPKGTGRFRELLPIAGNGGLNHQSANDHLLTSPDHRPLPAEGRRNMQILAVNARAALPNCFVAIC
jgi:hypothetical protein